MFYPATATLMLKSEHDSRLEAWGVRILRDAGFACSSG